MDQNNIESEGISVFEDFVCQAIPGSRVEDKAAFRFRLESMPTAEILRLVRQGGLSPEQLGTVREAVASRTAAHQSEIQQLNEILKTVPPR